MTSLPLYVVGASGLAREIAQLVEQIDPTRERWHVAGFVGRPDEVGRDLGFATVVGDDAWLISHWDGAAVVIGIGEPKARMNVIESKYRALPAGAFPNIIHPRALVDTARVRLGIGNCITAGCIFTCDISVGDFNLFNLNVTVGHDAVIGSYNVVNPAANVSGYTRLADGILIGTGAQVLEGRSIGPNSIIGAGAVVTKDVEPRVTVVGIPGRVVA